MPVGKEGVRRQDVSDTRSHRGLRYRCVTGLVRERRRLRWISPASLIDFQVVANAVATYLDRNDPEME